MEKWADFIWGFALSMLVIFFGGWLLGSLVNIAALGDPELVSAMFCPVGSTAIRQPAVDQSSPEGSAILCRARNGATVPNLSAAESQTLQRQYFYVPSDVLMIVLVAGWFIARRKKK